MHLQDMFDPDDKISVVKFYPHPKIVVAMKKLKLKEDEDGNKIMKYVYSMQVVKL